MTDFDYPTSVEETYRNALQRRVDAVSRDLEDALDELRGIEQASPADWDALLRRSERRVNRLFPLDKDRDDAEAMLRRIANQQRGALADELDDEDYADIEAQLDLDPETHFELLRDQLDSIRALVRDFYANLRRPETDEDGTVAIAALAATLATTAGVMGRRAAFYARDQVGVAYDKTTEQFHKTAGAESYIWLRTISKNPRTRHLKRVGREFRYDAGIDHPGQAHNCKCGKQPVFST